jgi:hypothetical protein
MHSVPVRYSILTIMQSTQVVNISTISYGFIIFLCQPGGFGTDLYRICAYKNR